VDEDLEKARSERRKRGFLSSRHPVSFGDLDLLTRVFDNQAKGEQTVLGRKTWRMESEPKPGYKAANKSEEWALASRRVNWFDREDGVVIKSSAFFIRAVNGFEPGTAMDWEWARIGDDWLRGELVMRVDVKIVLGIRARLESHQRFYDYKRFTADSKMTPE
jgi:hypothetical protein